MTGPRALKIISVVECLSLLLLLINLFTVHWSPVSSTLGPLHGLAYVGAIITATLIADGNNRVWLLALIPGIGGLLSTRYSYASSR